MTQKIWTAVDRYIAESLIPSDSILDETLGTNAAAGLPAIDVAPNQGKLLYLLAKMQAARRILEIERWEGIAPSGWRGRFLLREDW